jgi:site-specific DNA-methyltransferase (adenine-specific)
MGRVERIDDVATLYEGDCLQALSDVSGVDAVIADLPYGTTQNAWDSVIPLGLLWPRLWAAAKPTAVVALNAAQPFTSVLIASQLARFKYTWVWQKSRPTGHHNAKKQPLREHEEVCVFYRSQPTYNPQYLVGKPNHVGKSPRVKTLSGNYGKQYEVLEESTTRKYPKTILPFTVVSPTDVVHPTQKPVALIEYLIETYTLPGDTVLDMTMGSGTTGVAAANCGRRFIGIESDPVYFDIAVKRINEATLQRRLAA